MPGIHFLFNNTKKIDLVFETIKLYSTLLDMPDTSQMTPLHAACMSFDYKVSFDCEFLIRYIKTQTISRSFVRPSWLVACVDFGVYERCHASDC